MKTNLNNFLKDLFSQKITDVNTLMLIKRKLAKKYSISLPQNSVLLKYYRANTKNKNLKINLDLEKLLRKRAIRTMSGIAPVAVLTMPYPCPGECAFCPTEKNVPQSYLSNEPAVMRAIHCDYNPYTQVQYRLRALEANGHSPNKIELIVIGGTWSVLPEAYKYWYIINCFKAANNFQIQNAKITRQASTSKNQNYNAKIKFEKFKNQLQVEQKRNESAKYKIIGLTLETRPDYINETELWQMREFGCTRVELGVQAIDDKILKLNKRGHGVERIAEATKLLRSFGFKITYHIMPGLPESNIKKDLAMFKQLFSDPRFQPDQIKFYPTVVTKGSLMYKWWQQGKYIPYTTKQLENLIIACKKIIPRYVRIIRLIRDIPGESIEAGNKVTNLRQVLEQRGVECNCIRCREVKNYKLQITNYKLFIEKYSTSIGDEYFISYESKDQKTLYGFIRLSLPTNITPPFQEGAGGGYSLNLGPKTYNLQPALVRELHVYGELVPVGAQKKIQHSGLGKKLLAEAEKIAKENNYSQIKIISGIGVRNYYRKLGYRLHKTYLVKNIITKLYV